MVPRLPVLSPSFNFFGTVSKVLAEDLPSFPALAGRSLELAHRGRAGRSMTAARHVAGTGSPSAGCSRGAGASCSPRCPGAGAGAGRAGGLQRGPRPGGGGRKARRPGRGRGAGAAVRALGPGSPAPLCPGLGAGGEPSTRRGARLRGFAGGGSGGGRQGPEPQREVDVTSVMSDCGMLAFTELVSERVPTKMDTTLIMILCLGWCSVAFLKGDYTTESRS